MTTKNEKYVVIKRESWDEWLKAGGRALVLTAPDEVHDAVVIRRQDHFAPAALGVYANSISMVAKVLAENGETASARRLQGTADYFHEQAELSMDEAKKLPD